MPRLADAVLPLIRSRGDLHRYSAANAHGAQMHEGVDVLETALDDGRHDPAEVYDVTRRAVASAMKVILRADDSAGIIGDACHRLLDLHPRAAAAAQADPAKLVDWMTRFQLDGDVDFFELDPVAYAPALGEQGMETYRARLADVGQRLGLDPLSEPDYLGQHTHEQLVLQWNAKRLAVHDRDPDMIVRTHARDMRVAAWLLDTAKAFEEIGDLDRALEWAQRGALHEPWHQAQRSAEYWCSLLEEHRPEDLVEARRWMFDAWPSSSTATALHDAAGDHWPVQADHVMARLRASPRDTVLFVHRTLRDTDVAWRLAHEMQLHDADVWLGLVKDRQKTHPLEVLPVLRDIAEHELAVADANGYRRGARHLATMRRLAHDTPEQYTVDALIAELRETHRRRPRLQTELTRAGLP